MEVLTEFLGGPLESLLPPTGGALQKVAREHYHPAVRVTLPPGDRELLICLPVAEYPDPVIVIDQLPLRKKIPILDLIDCFARSHCRVVAWCLYFDRRTPYYLSQAELNALAQPFVMLVQHIRLKQLRRLSEKRSGKLNNQSGGLTGPAA